MNNPDSRAFAVRAAWNAWCSWCRSRSIDLFQAPITAFLDFLHYIYIKGRCYSTVNSYRSGVFVTIEAVPGYFLGVHKLVCRFTNGVHMFLERPPQPKYCVTWDVCVLTSYLCPHVHNIKETSTELTALIALVTAQRFQSLCSFNLDNLTVILGSPS